MTNNKQRPYVSSIKELMDAEYMHLGLIQASRFIESNFRSDVKIVVPSKKLYDLYRELLDNIPQSSLSHDFLVNGTKHLSRYTGDERTVSHVASFIAFKLHSICSDAKVQAPDWLPMVFREVPSKDTGHQFKYYFNWYSVKEECIPDSIYNLICASMNRYLSLEDKNKARFDSGGILSKSRPDSASGFENKMVIDTRFICDDVFFALVYSTVFKHAKRNNIRLLLTLEQMTLAIKGVMTDTQFHAQIKNTTVLSESDIMNCINLENESLGYTEGNLRLSRKRIDKLKYKFSRNEDDTVISRKKVMDIPFIQA